jgi:hypothetical protein
MRLRIFAFALALVFSTPALAETSFVTVDQYHFETGRPCACPWEMYHTKFGDRHCGAVSAFCRCGGYEPMGCYPGDDELTKRVDYQFDHCKEHACIYRRKPPELR